MSKRDKHEEFTPEEQRREIDELMKFMDSIEKQIDMMPKTGWHIDEERQRNFDAVLEKLNEISRKHPEFQMTIKTDVINDVPPLARIDVYASELAFDGMEELNTLVRIVKMCKGIGFLADVEYEGKGNIVIIMHPLYVNNEWVN